VIGYNKGGTAKIYCIRKHIVVGHIRESSKKLADAYPYEIWQH